MTPEPSPAAEVAARLGVIVTRVLVPLWLLVGALLKLQSMSPAQLPVALIQGAGAIGLDLAFVLRLGIAVELVVVVVIWLLPTLARAASIVMLVALMPVLIADIALGASSCGCFGPVEMNPWVTLVTDVALLLGVVLLGARAPSLRLGGHLPTVRTIAAGLLTIGCFAVAFWRPLGPATDVNPTSGQALAVSNGPSEGFYLPDYSSWMGRWWSEVDVSAWVRGMPADIDQGLQYVLFYRYTCEHCHELMEVYMSGELEAPVTIVAVPERGGFPTEGVLEVPCEECRRAELPAGVDWFFATPVLVRLVDGVVECAAEVSASQPECLLFNGGP